MVPLLVIIIIFLVIAAGIYCLWPAEPDVDVESVKIENVSWDNSGPIPRPGLYIKLRLLIGNDNYLGASISRVEGKVYLDDVEPGENDYIGDFEILEPFEVPSRGSTKVPVDFYLKELTSPGDAVNILKDDTAFIRVIGRVHISFPLCDFSVDFDHTQKVTGFL